MPECTDCKAKMTQLADEFEVARAKRNIGKARILAKELKGLKRRATHKLRGLDGTIVHVCDEHLKGWQRGCTEILPLKTRIVKNRFKLAVLAVALFLISTVAWAIFYYYTTLPAEIVTL